MSYKRVKGCFDIYKSSPEKWREPTLWTVVESAARAVADAYALHEIRTPMFEYTDVFLRTVGESSDIVSKEMYTFEDKGGRSLTLRPELTAPVMRACIENSLFQNGVNRLFYMGPCFRYDRAQKGRYRQFHQFGCEIVGSHDISTDVETISALLEFYRVVGLKNLKLLINSIGDKQSRDSFTKALQEHFTPLKEQLSEDSQRRLNENPLRIIDSKDAGDQKLAKDAPKISDFLSEKQKDDFAAVRQSLSDLGVDYTIDYSLVRGLDYYCDTVFEVVAAGDAKAQSTIGAGGRYDGLIKQMGGQDLPGVGFATGLERVIQTLLDQTGEIEINEGPDFFLIGLSEKCRRYLLPPLMKLRKEKYKALLHQSGFNVKKALSAAEKSGATYAVILGDEELDNQKFKLKHLASREEKEYLLTHLDNLGKVTHDTVEK